MKRDHVRAFAQTMTHDHVVVEATSNAVTVVAVITPHVGRVATANQHQVRMMAHADIKADTTVLTKLHASGCLPEVWVPDPQAQARRRKVMRCNQIFCQQVRLKIITQSIFRAHLLPQCPHADLSSNRGRNWLLEHFEVARNRAF